MWRRLKNLWRLSGIDTELKGRRVYPTSSMDISSLPVDDGTLEVFIPGEIIKKKVDVIDEINNDADQAFRF